MSYSWPIEPFDTPHPVRAYFNDPRISGRSRAFHFGIDISAPNGTAVYAVEAGMVHLEDARAISVAAASSSSATGMWCRPWGTARGLPAQLLGQIDAPWLHVHFAERRGGVYRDPLRPGALTPWHDGTRPKVTRILFSRNGTELPAASVHGAVDVIAEAHDTPPVSVPPPWNGLPVTPARLRWRVLRGAETVRPWHTPVDFRATLLPKSAFRRGSTRPGPARTTPASPACTASTSPTPGAPRCSRTATTSSRSRRSISYGNAGTRTQRFTLANNV